MANRYTATVNRIGYLLLCDLFIFWVKKGLESDFMPTRDGVLVPSTFSNAFYGIMWIIFPDLKKDHL